MCNHYMQFVTSSNDMMLIKLFAFFLLFKNSEACARSSLDNISTKSHTSLFPYFSLTYTSHPKPLIIHVVVRISVKYTDH